MTEQEAISVLKMIETHGSSPTYEKDESIKALEEIQQYRAIGTVNECREAAQQMKPKKTAMEAIKVHICPVCGFSGIYDYCGNCGQRVQMLSD